MPGTGPLILSWKDESIDYEALTDEQLYELGRNGIQVAIDTMNARALKREADLRIIQKPDLYPTQTEKRGRIVLGEDGNWVMVRKDEES